jgi:branched-chain amino acid transport system permease protein
MLIVSGVAVLVSRGSLGYALRAIREDEDAAEAMGVNARNYKVATLILSAFFVGVVGSVYAYWTTFLEPLALFDVENSIELVVVTLLGGVGTVAGPFLGAVVLQFASETVWIYFLNLHLLFLGAILVLVVIFIPNGIMDLLSQGKLSRASFLESIRKYRA